MNPGEFKISLIISWLIVTALTVPLMAAPFLFRAEDIYALAPKCEWKAKYGRECALCGMTTAFVRIAEGDLNGASKSNRGSVPLFACLLVNQAAGVVFATRGPLRRRRRMLCKS